MLHILEDIGRFSKAVGRTGDQAFGIGLSTINYRLSTSVWCTIIFLNFNNLHALRAWCVNFCRAVGHAGSQEFSRGLSTINYRLSTSVWCTIIFLNFNNLQTLRAGGVNSTVINGIDGLEKRACKFPMTTANN
jgi:hypothetical protein